MIIHKIEREHEISNNIIKILVHYLNPDHIILFGSRAKTNAPSNSDFDIAVDKDMADISLETKIMDEIEEISGLYKVDLVFLNSVDRDFRDVILKTGKIIYERGS